jgi:hypothetical protein
MNANGGRVNVTAAKVEILASGDLYFTTDGKLEAHFKIWAGYGLDDL